MTNEQLTQKVIELEANQVKGEAASDRLKEILHELQEDVKITKGLVEDVHIMAVNMQTIQKEQEEINKKVDALTSKEFIEYKENKKQVRSQLISVFIGSIGTFVVAFLGWALVTFIKGG